MPSKAGKKGPKSRKAPKKKAPVDDIEVIEYFQKLADEEETDVAGPKVGYSKAQIEALRPLMQSRPNLDGEIFIENYRGGIAICMSCGATDDMIMIRKHKKDCVWRAYWTAFEALRAMLDAK